MPLIICNCHLRSLFVVWLIVMYLIVVVVVRHCRCSPSLVSSLLSLFVFVGIVVFLVVRCHRYVVVHGWLSSSLFIVVDNVVVVCHRWYCRRRLFVFWLIVLYLIIVVIICHCRNHRSRRRSSLLVSSSSSLVCRCLSLVVVGMLLFVVDRRCHCSSSSILSSLFVIVGIAHCSCSLSGWLLCTSLSLLSCWRFDLQGI